MHLKLLKPVALVVFIILIAGCATTGKKVQPETLSKIKKLGIISLAAHEFHIKYTGLTVFGNTHEKHNISFWKIDEEYEVQIQNALTRLGLFETIQVPYDPKEFYPVYSLTGPWNAPAFRKPNWDAVEEILKNFADNNSLDAIIMVIERETDDFLAGSNQQIRGVGFYVRGIGDYTAVSALHLIAYIALIDGNTGKPLVTRAFNSTMKAVPELARTSFNELSETKKAEVRKMLIDLPKDTWAPIFEAWFESGKK